MGSSCAAHARWINAPLDAAPALAAEHASMSSDRATECRDAFQKAGIQDFCNLDRIQGEIGVKYSGNMAACGQSLSKRQV